MVKTGVAGAKPCFDDVVAVEVDETGGDPAQLLEQACLQHDEVSVTLVARTFGDEHGLCAEALEALCRGCDKRGMGIDVRAGNVVHQVRLEKDRFTGERKIEEPHPVEEYSGKAFRVVSSVQNSDSRSRRATVRVVSG